MLTLKQASRLFRYVKRTGKLYWKMVMGKSNRKVGQEAGTQRRGRNTTYRQVGVAGTNYQVHQIVWLLETGRWPKHQIDHEDRDGLNNKYSNLREATNIQNHQNLPLYRNNTSGHTGVHWEKRSSRWIAIIYDSGRRCHLGTFKSKRRAITTRAAAERSLGFHINHGRVA